MGRGIVHSSIQMIRSPRMLVCRMFVTKKQSERNPSMKEQKCLLQDNCDYKTQNVFQSEIGDGFASFIRFKQNIQSMNKYLSMNLFNLFFR